MTGRVHTSPPSVRGRSALYTVALEFEVCPQSLRPVGECHSAPLRVHAYKLKLDFDCMRECVRIVSDAEA